MITITDSDLEDKIAEIEGKGWKKHHQQWKEASGQPSTIPNALRMWKKNPKHVDSIYGAGGWHRYFVRPTGEVVFSTYHSTLRFLVEGKDSLQAKELQAKLKRVGFRSSEEAAQSASQ